MDLHQLKVFQSAARQSSFTAAARELNLSQSTVSLHIKQMEDELGCGLFVRSRKNVLLTEAGSALLQYADRMLAEAKNATLALQEFAEAKRGTIRLGVGATTLTYLLPNVLGAFRRKFPLLEIVVTTGTTEVLLEELLGNRLDFGIVMSPSEALREVQCLPLAEEELVVVLPSQHPLARRRALQPKDLDGVPWVSHLRGTAMHIVQTQYFERLGVRPQTSIELENMEAMKRLVANGFGAALLPLCAVTGEDGRGLTSKRVHGFDLTRELLLAAVDWSAQPPATRRLAGRIMKALSAGRDSKKGKAVIGETDDPDEDYVVSLVRPRP